MGPAPSSLPPHSGTSLPNPCLITAPKGRGISHEQVAKESMSSPPSQRFIASHEGRAHEIIGQTPISNGKERKALDFFSGTQSVGTNCVTWVIR